jgi:hypothetical protein
MEAMLLVWLVLLAVLQWSWCIYYGFLYRWRATSLGPVWLAKGSMLAVLWPLLVVNEAWHVPTWVWSLLVGPGLVGATAAWLWVTVHVRHRHPLGR